MRRVQRGMVVLMACLLACGPCCLLVLPPPLLPYVLCCECDCVSVLLVFLILCDWLIGSRIV